MHVKVVLPERLKPVLSSLPSDPEIAWYTDTESCIAAMPGAEVVWVHFGLTDIDTVFRAGTDLKWVTSAATGVDGWPLDMLRERHVVLTNGSGVGAIPISEYVVMGLLAGLKGLPAMVRAQDRREWLKSPPTMAELHGKRALVYGYGGIGRAIARSPAAFRGCRSRECGATLAARRVSSRPRAGRRACRRPTC